MILHASHDPTLVGLSFGVACLASYAALQLASRVLVATGVARALWLLGSAFTMGVGIWSMHFVAMLAFHVAVPVAYDVDLLLLSVLVAIAASLLAFMVVSRTAPQFGALAAASLLMGPAIAGMHYIGMASLRMSARIEYDRTLVTLSVIIAITASLAALRLSVAFRDDVRPRPAWHKPASAVLMALAICGMHYTGMAAARFIPTDGPALTGLNLLATNGLAYAVGFSAAIIAAIAVAAVLLDRSVRATLTEADLLRRSEELLRESQERLRFVLAAARMTTWDLDLDERTIFWSDHALFSATQTERLDDFLARVNADDRPAFEGALQQAGSEGQFDVDFRLSMAGGAIRWLHAEGRRLNAGARSERRLVGLSIDITERRYLEDQFRQAQKMEAVGQLAGGIAHDFNNLLTVIRGNTEITIDSMAPTDALRAGLQEVLTASERAAALTRQLLAFSRRQLMQLRPVNLNVVIRDFEPMLMRLVGEDIVIAIRLDPSVPAAMADRGQLEQILMNLALNARAAMPAGGTLRIDTGAAQSHDLHQASREEIVPGEYVLLKVSDTGSGIDPVIQARVFEPFFTTKGPGEGSGLGLSTVYGIVKQSGGHVFVDSRPGEGASFTIYLRCAPADGPAAPAAVESWSAAPNGSETILLVEDEAGVRRLTRQILERHGYRVLEATHGVHGLEVADRHDGPIHGLVTDVVMPEMGGRELAERLLDVRPDVCVLFMSAYTNDEILRRGLVDPSMAFIPKPFSAKAFVAAVRASLDAPARLRGDQSCGEAE
jgi:NO-binding membrane sensor protein with MHYT domain/nitrogen-specific signal transduction histidine kinase/ActR/RegA family two-component response regulator